MNFGQAIEALKNGRLMTRAGWNGKGMFLFMRPSDEINSDIVINSIKSIPQSVKDYFKAIEGSDVSDKPEPDPSKIKFTAYICMKAADGTIVNGWLASQIDMLSDDWCEFGVAAGT